MAGERAVYVGGSVTRLPLKIKVFSAKFYGSEALTNANQQNGLHIFCIHYDFRGAGARHSLSGSREINTTMKTMLRHSTG